MIQVFFPKPMLNAFITPHIKKRYDDLRSSSIYMEFRIYRTLLKLFDYYILPSFVEHGIPSLLQFAFRPISSLNEILKSLMLTHVFLDILKTFERVHRDILLQNRVEENISPRTVQVRNSSFHVKLKNAHSQSWTFK